MGGRAYCVEAEDRKLAGMPSGSDLVELARGAGPNAGALGLASYGVYGGQYAALFPVEYRGYASAICIAAMIIGVAIITTNLIRALFARPAKG